MYQQLVIISFQVGSTGGEQAFARAVPVFLQAGVFDRVFDRGLLLMDQRSCDWPSSAPISEGRIAHPLAVCIQNTEASLRVQLEPPARPNPAAIAASIAALDARLWASGRESKTR